MEGIGGQSVIVSVSGSGQSITVATPLADEVVGDNGWWTIFAPPGDEKRRDLAQIFGMRSGLGRRRTRRSARIPTAEA
jgi:putative ABC transport system permease protein